MKLKHSIVNSCLLDAGTKQFELIYLNARFHAVCIQTCHELKQQIKEQFDLNTRQFSFSHENLVLFFDFFIALFMSLSFIFF